MGAAVRWRRRHRVRLKLAFMGWGIGIRELDFTGFSGHSALSASIWPVMMWLLTGRFSTAVRKTAVLSGYALALLIGYSRPPSTYTPFRKSSAASHWGRQQRIFMAAAQYCTASPVIPKIAAALLLPLLLINNGTIAPTRGLLEFIAVSIAPIDKPFTREDMHANVPVAYNTLNSRPPNKKSGSRDFSMCLLPITARGKQSPSGSPRPANTSARHAAGELTIHLGEFAVRAADHRRRTAIRVFAQRDMQRHLPQQTAVVFLHQLSAPPVPKIGSW